MRGEKLIRESLTKYVQIYIKLHESLKNFFVKKKETKK